MLSTILVQAQRQLKRGPGSSILGGDVEAGSITENAFTTSIFSVGLLCVKVFFCLSGFLVFDSFLRNFHQKNAIQAFYLKRFLRIIPLWWLVLSGRFFLQKDIPVDVFVANLFFYLGDLTNSSRYLPIAVGWSLLAELVFYLFFPFAVRLLSLRGAIIFTAFFAGLNYLIFFQMFTQ